MTIVPISVTAADIAAGKKNDSTCCPIALACLRVGLEPEQFKQRIDYMQMPSAATDFVESFDRGETVDPFEFGFVID